MANMPSLSTFPLAAVLAQARSMGATSQVRSGLGLTAVGAGSLGVTVASGTAWVDSVYLNYAGAGSPVTPGAASATLARYDLIVFASGAVVPSVVAGTAASAPVPPALPSGALFLGYVFIGPGATDYTVQATAFIADYTMPVASFAGTAAAPVGFPVGDLDTGWLFPGADRVQQVTGGVARWETTSSGHVVPVSTSITDLGSSTQRWRDVNAVSVRADTADIGRITNWPRCRVFNSANLTMASTATTCLTFDSERYDDASMHSSTTNPSRLTLVTSGVWLIGGGARLASVNSIVDLLIRMNGVASLTIADEARIVGGLEPRVAIVGEWYASVSGDYVELVVNNPGAAATSVIADTQFSPEFWAVRIG